MQSCFKRRLKERRDIQGYILVLVFLEVDLSQFNKFEFEWKRDYPCNKEVLERYFRYGLFYCKFGGLSMEEKKNLWIHLFYIV